MSSPVIILTGASRGIGFAVAQFLLRSSSAPRVLLVSRTASALESLKSAYPSQVEYIAGDLGSPDTAGKVVQTAVESFGRLDALIINHATLDPVGRLDMASFDTWRSAFEINLFSAVALVFHSFPALDLRLIYPELKEAIPELRRSKGRVVFVSSGAAETPYQGWGAYGSSKAAMNHLNATLAAEEPEIMSIAVRPGVIGLF